MVQSGSKARDDGSRHVESLLSHQADLFGRLDALSQQQAELIRQDETDRLLSLLGERQDLIDQIAATNTQLEPYRGRWDAFLGELTDAGRERVRVRLDAVAKLADLIAQRDETDRRQMQVRRDAMAADLAKVASGRGAMAAYGTAGSEPRFQDREA